MNYNIKMVALDLDGTLLNEQKQISERTLKAIQAAIERGVVVLPATGRPISGVPGQVLQIPGIRYVLTANGAAVFDREKNQKLHEECMEAAIVSEILERLKPFEVMADIFVDGMGYVEKKNLERSLDYFPPGPIREYVNATRKPVDSIKEFLMSDGKKVEKITINFLPDGDGELKGKQETLALLAQYKGLAVVSGIPTNLEVTKDAATKGNGLVALGRLLGIRQEEIMACGDSGNDREMLKTVGLGVAMKNATDDVLEVADAVTGSNEEDGVAQAIERYVLGLCY